MEWNKCFLCLVELTSGKRSRKKKVDPKILLRYLLDTPNHVNDNVTKNVLRTMRSDDGVIPASSPIQFCEECETTARQISELHLELEVIQMKLADNIKSIQNKVISNSKVYGRNEVTKMCLEVFEDWLNIRENAGINHAKERETLKNLYEFQAAVYEKQRQAIQIPLLYLQQYVLKLKTDLEKEILQPDVIVKKEPEAILNDNEDLMPDSPFFSEGTSVTTCTSSELMSAESFEERKSSLESQKRDKEEASKEKAIVPSSEIKLENDTKPCRKRSRAGATIASERIMKLKKQKLSAERNLHNSNFKMSCSKVITSNVTVTRKARTKSPKEKTLRKGIPKSKKGMKRIKYETQYCDLCPYTIRRIQPFECHLRSHETDDKKFNCEKCDERFSVKQHYELHKSFHKQGGGPRFTCEICWKKISPLDNPEHLKTHSDKVFICTQCTFSCLSRERFDDHLRLHSSLPVVCDICSETQRNRKKYLKHMCEVHNVNEKFPCDVENCTKIFYTSDSLWSHKRGHKRENEKVTCETCGAQFKEPFYLKVHEMKHTGERPFQCDECSQAFLHKHSLAQHKIKEHGAPKFKCPNCPKQFTTKFDLNAHLRLHEGEGFPCGQCDKVFAFPHKLREHLPTHTQEKKCICEECGKGFRTTNAMKKHQLIHDGEKKFKCTYCPKAFVLEKYLICHVRIHTGERPFVCDTCGKDFNQYAALSVHKKKHLLGSQPTKKKLDEPALTSANLFLAPAQSMDNELKPDLVLSPSGVT